MNYPYLKQLEKRDGVLKSAEISELQSVISDFPFYAMPYRILAKHYHRTNHYKFEETLLQAALRAGDRAELFDFIHSDETYGKEVLTETKQTNISSGSQREEMLIDETPAVETESTYEPENEIISEEDLSGQTIDGKPEPSIEITQKPVHQPNAVVETNLSEAILEKSDETVLDVPNTKTVLTETESEFNETAEEDRHKDFYYWLQHPQKPKYRKVKVPKAEKTADIIDRFVEINPVVSRPAREFYKAENMAKKSEILHTDFISETLAEIYAQSGNYTQAIEVYTKLSLQIPEKQAYFASLIEKIRSERKIK